MAARPNANCNLEDICAEIGYRATRILAGWYGGRNLSVPVKARETHPIAQLIGYSAFLRLVAAFPGEQIALRSIADDLTIHRHRQAADAFHEGKSVAEVAALIGVTTRHAQSLKTAMTANGLIDYSLVQA